MALPTTAAHQQQPARDITEFYERCRSRPCFEQIEDMPFVRFVEFAARDPEYQPRPKSGQH